MKISLKVNGVKQAREQIEQIDARIQNLDPAFLRGAMVALAAAQGRIETGGDGSWPATIQTSPGTSLNRGGFLLRSLQIGNSDNYYERTSDGVRFGTQYTENGYNIGALMQYGTGVYGPTGQPIKPTSGKFLKFELNGHTVFARSVKGSPQRWFLFFDEQTADQEGAVFLNYIMTGNTDAGS